MLAAYVDVLVAALSVLSRFVRLRDDAARSGLAAP